MPTERQLNIQTSKVTVDRFKRQKTNATERMGRDELDHDEFLLLLLDVWEYHLDESDRVKP